MLATSLTKPSKAKVTEQRAGQLLLIDSNNVDNSASVCYPFILSERSPAVKSNLVLILPLIHFISPNVV